ncbi:MAG TPA: BON domain-containing protein [Burkholderiales bacterium]|nr:BON domain-containing protein [Burkholderiales bacterium]
MNTKFVAGVFTAGALMLPIAGHSADSDTDRSSPSAFVKDSVITAKIKAELAEQKLSSLLHVRVDTDANGAVVLSGTAKTKRAADDAVAVARGVDGVTSVQSNIRVAGVASAPVLAAKETGEKRAEARINKMHARLNITPAQESQWSKVAQVMRDNAKTMDALTQARFEHSKTMTAVDDLKSYGEITDAHADGVKKFAEVFAPLYASMPDDQKKEADDVFRHGDRTMSKRG